MVSDSDLVARLREILRDSDLDTATAGSVRKQLEKDFGIDLSDRKSFVRDQIDIFLETLNRDNEKEGEDEQAPESENEELQEENDDEEEEESNGEGSQNTRRSKSDKKAKKRGGGFQTVCSLSPQLQKVVGESKLARTEVVKKLWAYIKEKDLQDPKNKRNIICDELLRDIFRVNSINMFQMNKALTKHIWPLSVEDDSNHEMECEDNNDSASMNAESAKGEVKEEEKEEDDSVSMNAESAKGEENEEEKEEDDSESLNAENSKEEKEEEKEGEQEEEEDNEEEEEEQEGNSRRSKKKRSSKGDKDVKRRGGGFTKLCSLSPQLQAFIGESELARTEVVKRLWTYIREKNLQDPKDKRNVLCDDSLYALFRVKSINMFQMNKALSKHIWPLNEEEVAVQADSAKTERKSKQARERVAEEPKQKEKKQKKGASGFLAPLPLSDALVKFFATGENALSRADVVKKIWEYIKQNDLQDPSDKRRILCDDKLKELFEVDSFNGFAMTKLLTTHFIKMEQ
ncbi:hypothetical protein ES288_A03G232000v1 [Gossypium darwinii]|uniref:DM2 domain-containing protein n=1 Tax=Gossypium darwinii TaxID=34276 RepID=A0A5D2H9N8_GOSDA|nr:hypothetical protein ES288_A03G232000v1 [Gossypium darwinii]